MKLGNTDEKILKNHLVAHARQLLPSYEVFRVETSETKVGVPDIVCNGDMRTSWVEVKYATPNFKSREVQRQTVLRLAKTGFAWYIVFYEHLGVKRTYIVPAEQIHAMPVSNLIYTISPTWTNVVEGFDYRRILIYLRGLHRDYVRP